MKGSLFLVALVALAPVAARAKAPASCSEFERVFAQGLGDVRVTFTKALTVRGRSAPAASGVEVFDVQSDSGVDASVHCRGDEFVRFEAKLGLPARERTMTQYDRYQAAALHAAMRWDGAKLMAVLPRMTRETGEFLAASHQRGDVAISGVNEMRAEGGVSIGMLWTDSDRIFVISTPADG